MGVPNSIRMARASRLALSAPFQTKRQAPARLDIARALAGVPGSTR